MKQFQDQNRWKCDALGTEVSPIIVEDTHFVAGKGDAGHLAFAARSEGDRYTRCPRVSRHQ